MLVLSRDIGQKIIIADEITITILGIRGCQVRVGIDAPKIYSVNREEIDKIIKSKQNINRLNKEKRIFSFQGASYEGENYSGGINNE